jgi:HTH-type transcriptional regulator, glycine betaine synthesis regulator
LFFLSSRPTSEAVTSTPFEQECVLFFEEIVQLFGVPKSVGQIYGLLYASPAPLSFSDIVDRLGISKGSASQGLQLLRSLGAILEADAVTPAINLNGSGSSSPRATRVVYAPELSLRQLVTGVLRERIAPMATNSGKRLSRLKDLAGQSQEGTEFYLERASQLTKWSRRFTTVLPVLTALLGPKKKPKRK